MSIFSVPVLTTGAEFYIISAYEKYEKCERRLPWPLEAREMFNIQPGDTLLILGETDAGLIVSRPEALNALADKLLNTVKSEEEK